MHSPADVSHYSTDLQVAVTQDMLQCAYKDRVEEDYKLLNMEVNNYNFANV